MCTTGHLCFLEMSPTQTRRYIRSPSPISCGNPTLAQVLFINEQNFLLPCLIYDEYHFNISNVMCQPYFSSDVLKFHPVCLLISNQMSIYLRSGRRTMRSRVQIPVAAKSTSWFFPSALSLIGHSYCVLVPLLVGRSRCPVK